MQAAFLERDEARVPAAEMPAAAPARRRRLRTGIIWGGLCLVAGATFWHAVAYSGFLFGRVLADGADAELVRVASARHRLERSELLTIHLVDPRSCTALELDRAANRTAVRPCPNEGLALRLEPVRPREDLAAIAPQVR
jgi:hypothetical protein